VPPFVLFAHDIGEERGGKGTPPLMSIWGTGLRHRRAPAMTILRPSRDDLAVGLQTING